MAGPALSVVVASHDRPLRLRWLLNALETQTLGRDEWEVVVAHDSSDSETETLLREHPLGAAGVMRHLTFPPGPGPAVKRNAAWRLARAPLIVFTDDDCRPPNDWLARVLESVRAHPGAIVQGATRPDPNEALLLTAGPFALTQNIDPPTAWAQTCNIVYPRAVLEAVGGFDERLPVAAGEDTDLAARAAATGAPYVGAPEVLTYHAVQPATLRQRLRTVKRWGDLAYVVKRHPRLRSELYMGVFWKRTHVWFPFAVVGGLIGRRRPLALALALPWLINAAPAHGHHPRGRVRSLLELPGRAVIDGAEMLTLARGSIRHRTLML